MCLSYPLFLKQLTMFQPFRIVKPNSSVTILNLATVVFVSYAPTPPTLRFVFTACAEINTLHYEGETAKQIWLDFQELFLK